MVRKVVIWALFCVSYFVLFNRLNSDQFFFLSNPIYDLQIFGKVLVGAEPVVSHKQLPSTDNPESSMNLMKVTYPWLHVFMTFFSAAVLVSAVKLSLAGFILIVSMGHFMFFGYPGNFWIYWILFLTAVFLLRFTLRFKDTRSQSMALVLTLISVLGLFLNVPGLARFDKWSYHPDEPVKLKQVAALKAEESRTSPFLHPPLMIKVFVFFEKQLSEMFEDPVTLYRVVQKGWTFFGLICISGIAAIRYGRLAAIACLTLGLCSSLVFATGFYLKEDAPLFAVTSLAYFLFLISNNSRLLGGLALVAAWLSACFKYSGLLNVAILSTLFVVKHRSLLSVVWCMVSGMIVSYLFFPELFSSHRLVSAGFFYEVQRGLLNHHGFSINGVDFLYLFGAVKTFLLYENPLFFLLATLALKMAVTQKDYAMVALVFLYYFLFEISGGKPPPQPERYYLLVYVFLLPMISRLVYTNASPLLFLASLANLLVNCVLVLRPTERVLIKQLENNEARTVVHTGYVVADSVWDRWELLHLNFNTLKNIAEMDLPPNQVIFVTTNTHLYRYREFRLNRLQRRRACFFRTLLNQMQLKMQVGTPLFQKGYLNNTYFIFNPKDSLSRILRTARKCL